MFNEFREFKELKAKRSIFPKIHPPQPLAQFFVRRG
jgi:hypothetical protein